MHLQFLSHWWWCEDFHCFHYSFLPLLPAELTELAEDEAVKVAVVAAALLLSAAILPPLAEAVLGAVTGIAGALVLLLAVRLIFTLVPTRLGLDTIARAGFLSSGLLGWLSLIIAGGFVAVLVVTLGFRKCAAWDRSSCRCCAC